MDENLNPYRSPETVDDGTSSADSSRTPSRASWKKVLLLGVAGVLMGGAVGGVFGGAGAGVLGATFVTVHSQTRPGPDEDWDDLIHQADPLSVVMFGGFMGGYFGGLLGGVVGLFLGITAGLLPGIVRGRFTFASAVVCGIGGALVGAFGGAMLTKLTDAVSWLWPVAGTAIGAMAGSAGGVVLGYLSATLAARLRRDGQTHSESPAALRT